MPKKKAYTSPSIRRSSAHVTAVYGGSAVKSFQADLSNYASLRRGLSATMREQTLGVKTLKQASSEAQSAYINVLNDWREMSQAAKKERARSQNPVEDIFKQAASSDFYNATERAEIAAANIKLKTMSADQAQVELMEGLNILDRSRNADFYAATYFLETDSFDPERATDDMLRQVISSGTAEQYPGQKEAIIKEYMRRLGETGDTTGAAASEVNSYRQDILALARMILY